VRPQPSLASQGTKFATLPERLRNLGTREQSRKSFAMYTKQNVCSILLLKCLMFKFEIDD